MKKITLKGVLGLIESSNKEGATASALKENFVLFIKGERSLLSVIQMDGVQQVLKKEFLFERIAVVEKVFAIRHNKNISIVIVAALDDGEIEYFCLGSEKSKDDGDDEKATDSASIPNDDTEIATGYFAVLERFFGSDGIAEYTVQEQKEEKNLYSFSTLYTKKHNKYLENTLRLLIAFSGLSTDIIKQCSYVIDYEAVNQLTSSAEDAQSYEVKKNDD